MIRQNQLHGMPSKLGATRTEDPPSASVKNAMPHLSGHKPRMVAKNGSNSKPPDLYLSTESREKGRTRFTVSKAPQWDLALRDSFLEPEREHQPPRRPLKLAPLEFSREVTESQKQKIKEGMQETTASARRPQAEEHQPDLRTAKPSARRPQAEEHQPDLRTAKPSARRPQAEEHQPVLRTAKPSARRPQAEEHQPVLRTAKPSARNCFPKSPEQSSYRTPVQPPRAQKSPKSLLPAFQVKQNTAPLTWDASLLHTAPSPELYPGAPGRVVELGGQEPVAWPDASLRYQRLRSSKGVNEEQNRPKTPTAEDDGKLPARNAMGQRTEMMLKEAGWMLDRSRRPSHKMENLKKPGKATLDN